MQQIDWSNLHDGQTEHVALFPQTVDEQRDLLTRLAEHGLSHASPVRQGEIQGTLEVSDPPLWDGSTGGLHAVVRDIDTAAAHDLWFWVVESPRGDRSVWWNTRGDMTDARRWP